MSIGKDVTKNKKPKMILQARKIKGFGAYDVNNYPFRVDKYRFGKAVSHYFNTKSDAINWIRKEIKKLKLKGWKFTISKNTGESIYVYEQWLGAKRLRFKYKPIEELTFS